jgi:hypothetical protein
VQESGVVRAWTGLRLGANLGRFLSPADTWRVMQALGEFGGDSGGASELARPERRRPAGRSQAVGGLTRGQFLKGVGGAAVAMSVLSTTSKLVSPAGAAQGSTTSGSVMSAGDEVAGASISYPAKFIVEREQFMFDDTYGFTLWKPKSGSSRGAHEHGETTPAVRVARPASSGPRRSSDRPGPGSPSIPIFR